MWRAVDNVYDDEECRQYINRRPNGYSEFYSINHRKFHIPTDTYHIQGNSVEYEDYFITSFKHELVPFALRIYYEDNCSAIVKIYGGVKIETNGRSISKWFLLYKKIGYFSYNSTILTLVKPLINGKRMMNTIRIHYDYTKITNIFSSVDVTFFESNTYKVLQIFINNETLKISSKTEKFAIENGNEKNLDYFLTLPNEIIAKIFGYFDLKTLARTAQVCSRFNNIITKTDNFYYNLDFTPYWNVLSADVFDRFMDKTKNLKKLHLDWCNEFPNSSYDSKLEEFLNGAKNTLTHLYIDGDMSGLTDGLIKAIFACKELLELHLRSTKIDFRYYEWFNADIIQCKNLRKLDLTDSEIIDTALITIISETRKLKHLILDWVRIFDLEMRIIYMDDILKKLVEFDINIETWSSWGGTFASRNLSLFQFHTNLEELNLSGGSYTDYRTLTFNFLANCSRLKRLSLAHWWRIEDNHLITVIENCEKVEQVNISYLNWITAKTIKKFLKLKNLKILNIANCTHETISIFQIKEWRKEYPQVQIRSHHLE